MQLRSLVFSPNSTMENIYITITANIFIIVIAMLTLKIAMKKDFKSTIREAVGMEHRLTQIETKIEMILTHFNIAVVK